MATVDPLLKVLRESPDFQVIMKGISKGRPVIPDYKPQPTMDETANLMERIKHQSALQQGWDLLYITLVGKE